MAKSKWRGKYASPAEYYLKKYDPQYYQFNEFQLEIDPDETLEEVEAYDHARQVEETKKCARSFAYFCHKYVKILHPTEGLIPFVLYGYQVKVIEEYEDHRFNIISKFRQGGLTTVSLLWGLWRCMFQLDQQIMLLSKTDREATDIGLMADRAIENFPEWLKPKKEGKWNDHIKQFKDTGGALRFYSPEAARGKNATFLIIDEAAFIGDMDTHWKAMWPMLSTGGSCVLISTVNGMGNWYQITYDDAKNKRNFFNVIDLDYDLHPNYNNNKWLAEQKAQLGDRGFRQEVLREFLGSGETFIKSEIIRKITLETNAEDRRPIHKMYARWVNDGGRVAQMEEEDFRGALWIWQHPLPNREYVIGVDVGEGQQGNNDSSIIEVIDSATLEQVAEFYSNMISPTHFAQVVQQIGLHYNSALVVVESNGPGSATLHELYHKYQYENLYYDSSKKNAAPGVRLTAQNRPLILECLANHLTEDALVVNSRRFAGELQTFEFNPKTGKAEASKNNHDDAIVAMSLALYVRESMSRDMPLGLPATTEKISSAKAELFEEIRRELEAAQNGSDLWGTDEDEDLLSQRERNFRNLPPTAAVRFRNRHSSILSEFDM